MRKTLIQMVACLLVPILIMDPVSAFAFSSPFSHQGIERALVDQDPFSQQALSEALLSHPILHKGIKYFERLFGSFSSKQPSAGAPETKEEDFKTSLTPREWLRLVGWHFRSQIHDLYYSEESSELAVEKIRKDLTAQLQLSEYMVKTRTVFRLDTSNPEDSLLCSARNHFYLHIHIRSKKNSDNVIILNIPISLDGTLGREILSEGHGASIFMPLEPVAGHAIVDWILQEATKEIQPYRERLIERMHKQVDNPDLPMIAMGLVLAPTAEQWWVMPIVSVPFGRPITAVWKDTAGRRLRLHHISVAHNLPYMYVGDFQQEPTVAQLRVLLSKAPYHWVYGKIGKEYFSKQYALAEILARELKRTSPAEDAPAAVPDEAARSGLLGPREGNHKDRRDDRFPRLPKTNSSTALMTDPRAQAAASLWDMDLTSKPSPFSWTNVQVFDLDDYDISMKDAGLPGEPQKEVAVLQHPQLGTVYIAREGKLVLVQVDPAHPVAIYSPQHFTCSAMMIRALDPSGHTWIGHAHFRGHSYSNETGQRGFVYDSMLRVLDYLNKQKWSRIQVQLGVNADLLDEIPPITELETDLSRGRQDVTILRTQRWTKDDSMTTVTTPDWKVLLRNFGGGIVRHSKVIDWPPAAAPAGGVVKSMGPNRAMSTLDYDIIRKGFNKHLDVVFHLSAWPGLSWKHRAGQTALFAEGLRGALRELEELRRSLPSHSPLEERIDFCLHSLDNNNYPIRFRVSTTLKGVTSVRYFNPETKEVEIIFSERFYDAVTHVLNGDDDDEAAGRWFLLERLYHELGHTNTSPADDDTYFHEEHNQVLSDFLLLKHTLSDPYRHGPVDHYFAVHKGFGSSDYFRFLISLMGMESKARRRAINDYLVKHLPRRITRTTVWAMGHRNDENAAAPAFRDIRTASNYLAGHYQTYKNTGISSINILIPELIDELKNLISPVAAERFALIWADAIHKEKIGAFSNGHQGVLLSYMERLLDYSERILNTESASHQLLNTALHDMLNTALGFGLIRAQKNHRLRSSAFLARIYRAISEQQAQLRRYVAAPESARRVKRAA